MVEITTSTRTLCKCQLLNTILTTLRWRLAVNSHMHIVKQIINVIPKRLHVFIQDRHVYKHNNTGVVSLHIIFRKKIL